MVERYYEGYVKQGGDAPQGRQGDWDTGKWGVQGVDRDVSPYQPGAPGWDAQGFPEGRMPIGDYAFDWQHEAERRAQQRRDSLWGDANQALQHGMDLFQSYRQGGSAALASGLFQSQANLLGTQAQTIQAPDLLSRYRAEEQRNADEDRQRAERLGMAMALGGAALGAAGGGLGSASLTGLGAGMSAAGGAVSAGQQQGGGQTVGAGGVAASPAGGVVAQQAGAAPAVPIQGGVVQGQPQQGGAAVQSAGAAPAVPSGGPAAPTGGVRAGGYGAPGAGGPGGGAGPDSPTGGGAGAQGGVQGGMAAAGAQGLAGDAPMQMFTGQEAAANTMATTPAAGVAVYPSWARDAYRESGLSRVMQAARSRLLAAMGHVSESEEWWPFRQHFTKERLRAEMDRDRENREPWNAQDRDPFGPPGDLPELPDDVFLRNAQTYAGGK